MSISYSLPQGLFVIRKDEEMSYNVTPEMMQENVSASRLKALEFVLAERELIRDWIKANEMGEK